MNRPLAMALAATLALGTSAANAAAVVSTELSNFRFQLIDLDASDGIAPSVDLSAYPGSQVVAGGDLPFTQVDGTEVFGPAQVSVTGRPGLSASGAIVGDLSSGGIARAGSTAGDFPGQLESTSGSAFCGSLGSTSMFTLSPHTELLMTGTADVAASATVARGFDEIATGEVDFAFASAPGVFDRHAVFSLYADNWDPAALDNSGHADLSLAFSNTTDAPLQGGFYVYVWTLSSTGTVPIPEPGNITLMLAALGGMALIARGRRRSR